ncbi:MAG: phage tail tape measure protein [Nitrospinae bacterium]|nr:phage tail tape measure protein [Nitrospinota bacterium]
MATEKTTELSIVIRARNAAKEALDQIGRQFDGLVDTARKHQAELRQVGTALTAVGATGAAALTVAAKAAGDLEQQMFNVRKTSGLSADEIDRLKKSIIDMSGRVPLAANDLGKIAAIAGQLGIQGRKDIEAFTETVAKIVTVTDFTVEGAAESLARLSNLFHLPIQEVGKLGGVINEMENTTTAKAPGIAEMMKRIATAAVNLGLKAPDVAGLSATLIDLGFEAELAGTQVSQTFLDMIRNADAFGAQIGMTGRQFRASMERDAIGTFLRWAEAMHNLPKEELLQSLEQTGIAAGRDTAVFLSLVGAYDKLKINVGAANEEFRVGTSLQKEFETFMQSAWNQVKILGNTLGGLSAMMGNSLLPVIRSAADAGKGFLKWLQDLPDAAKTAVLWITALTAAVAGFGGAMLIFLGFLPQIVAGFNLIAAAGAGALAFFGKFAIAVGAVVAAWETARFLGDFIIAGKPMRQWFNETFVLWTQAPAEMKQSMAGVKAEAAKGGEALGSALKAGFVEWMRDIETGVNVFLLNLITAAKNWAQKFAGFFERLKDSPVAALRNMGEVYSATLREMAAASEVAALHTEDGIKNINKKYDEMLGLTKAASDATKELGNSMGGAAKKTGDLADKAQKLSPLLKAAIEEIDKLNKGAEGKVLERTFEDEIKRLQYLRDVAIQNKKDAGEIDRKLQEARDARRTRDLEVEFDAIRSVQDAKERSADIEKELDATILKGSMDAATAETAIKINKAVEYANEKKLLGVDEVKLAQATNSAVAQSLEELAQKEREIDLTRVREGEEIAKLKLKAREDVLKDSGDEEAVLKAQLQGELNAVEVHRAKIKAMNLADKDEELRLFKELDEAKVLVEEAHDNKSMALERKRIADRDKLGIEVLKHAKFNADEELEFNVEMLKVKYQEYEKTAKKIAASEEELVRFQEILQLGFTGELRDTLERNIELRSKHNDDLKSKSNEQLLQMIDDEELLKERRIAALNEFKSRNLSTFQSIRLAISEYGLESINVSKNIVDFTISSFKSMERGISKAFFDPVTGQFLNLKDGLNGLFDSIKTSFFQMLADMAARLAVSGLLNIGSRLLGFSSGGLIPEDGLFAGQAGEAVLTRNAVGLLGKSAISALNSGAASGSGVAGVGGAGELASSEFALRGGGEFASVFDHLGAGVNKLATGFNNMFPGFAAPFSATGGTIGGIGASLINSSLFGDGLGVQIGGTLGSLAGTLGAALISSAAFTAAGALAAPFTFGLSALVGGVAGGFLGSLFGGGETLNPDEQAFYPAFAQLKASRPDLLVSDFTPGGADIELLMAMTRLSHPNTGADSISDSFRLLGGGGIGEDEIDTFTRHGLRDIVKRGVMTRQAMEDAMTFDLGIFKPGSKLDYLGEFDRGGVLKGPGLFRVGNIAEAMVPLSDGRNIPVRIERGNDDDLRGILDEFLTGLRDQLKSGSGRAVQLVVNLDGREVARSMVTLGARGVQTTHPRGVYA